MRCKRCGGVGIVARAIGHGNKVCPVCGGSGQQPGPDRAYKDLRDAYRDAADEWMDLQEKDWTPDYEGGGWVPAKAAEEWSSPDGAWRDWDGWQT